MYIQFSDLTDDAPLHRPLHRLVLSCLGMGLLIAVLTLLLATLDQARERARESTSLRIVGSSRRTLLRAEAVQQLVSVVTALALGSTIGLFCGYTYLAFAGDKVPFTVGFQVAAALCGAAVVLVMGIAAITARGGMDRIDPELIRRE